MSFSNTVWFGNSPLFSSTEKQMSLALSADGVATITRRWQATATTLKLRQTPIRGVMPALPYGFATWGSINALCISSEIHGTEKAEIYELIEVYQGYVALPSRLARPRELRFVSRPR